MNVIALANRPLTRADVKWMWRVASWLSFAALALWCIGKAVPPVHAFITPDCQPGSDCTAHRVVWPGILPTFFAPLTTLLIHLFATGEDKTIRAGLAVFVKRASDWPTVVAMIIAISIAAIGFLAVFTD